MRSSGFGRSAPHQRLQRLRDRPFKRALCAHRNKMVRPEFRRRFIRAIQLFEVLKSSIGHFLSFSFPFRQSLLPDFRRCSSLNEAVGFAGSVKSLPDLIAVMTLAKAYVMLGIRRFVIVSA